MTFILKQPLQINAVLGNLMGGLVATCPADCTSRNNHTTLTTS